MPIAALLPVYSRIRPEELMLSSVALSAPTEVVLEIENVIAPQRSGTLPYATLALSEAVAVCVV